MMQKQFVRFYWLRLSCEYIDKPISDWDTKEAARMAKTCNDERGKPACFQFITRERGDDDLDSHESNRSGEYYINGKVCAIEDFPAEADWSGCVQKMKNDGWKYIVLPSASMWPVAFQPGRDHIVDDDGNIIE